MSSVSQWVRARAPEPPGELLGDLDLESLDAREGDPGETLFVEGRRRLDLARARPGRVRESAFHLLAADALVTYACEAALEAGDEEAALLEFARGSSVP